MRQSWKNYVAVALFGAFALTFSALSAHGGGGGGHGGGGHGGYHGGGHGGYHGGYHGGEHGWDGHHGGWGHDGYWGGGYYGGGYYGAPVVGVGLDVGAPAVYEDTVYVPPTDNTYYYTN